MHIRDIINTYHTHTTASTHIIYTPYSINTNHIHTRQHKHITHTQDSTKTTRTHVQDIINT
uniref:Uncharacterized protein n=1 Tax=Arion vulgaris TaxID=1028688 RepID=A0A0B7B8G8_9EUPU